MCSVRCEISNVKFFFWTWHDCNLDAIYGAISILGSHWHGRSLPKLVLCVVMTLPYRNLSKLAAVILCPDSLFTRTVAQASSTYSFQGSFAPRKSLIYGSPLATYGVVHPFSQKNQAQSSVLRWGYLSKLSITADYGIWCSQTKTGEKTRRVYDGTSLWQPTVIALWRIIFNGQTNLSSGRLANVTTNRNHDPYLWP